MATEMNKTLKFFLSHTVSHRALIFGMKFLLMNFYPNCPAKWLASGICKPGVPGSIPARGTGHRGVSLGKALFPSLVLVRNPGTMNKCSVAEI